VVCNLYPFEQTVAKENVTTEEARANIDIGGPTMIRAAAKNYPRTAVLTQPSDYDAFISQIRQTGGGLILTQRFLFAQKAFAHTAAYDKAISGYLKKCDSEKLGSLYSFAPSE